MHTAAHRTDNASLYLLFAGRHGQPAGGTGSLIAAYASREEARAAFLEARLGLSDNDGWAELTAVAAGAKAKPISWFGRDAGRSKEPAWCPQSDSPSPRPPRSRRPLRRLSARIRRAG